MALGSRLTLLAATEAEAGQFDHSHSEQHHAGRFGDGIDRDSSTGDDIASTLFEGRQIDFVLSGVSTVKGKRRRHITELIIPRVLCQVVGSKQCCIIRRVSGFDTGSTGCGIGADRVISERHIDWIERLIVRPHTRIEVEAQLLIVGIQISTTAIEV